jgi:hypothetical protein
VTTAAAGHERRDVSTRWALLGGLVLTLLVGLGVGVAWVARTYLVAREARRSPPPPPLAAPEPRLPPEPRLQAAPGLDLAALRAWEDARLQGYGWVDRDAGVAHVPIERAMELLAARGTVR